MQLSRACLDEIPHDEEVARELHHLDHRDLKSEPFLVGLDRVLEQALLCHRLQVRPACFKPLVDDFLEIGIGSETRRDLEGGERLRCFYAQVAALGDPHRVEQRLGYLPPELGHFVGGFEVELVAAIAHPVGVLHGLSRADAQQHIVGHAVILGQVVAIVRANQRDAGLAGDLDQIGIDLQLAGEAVVLQLEKKVSRTENIGQLAGFLQGGVELLHQQFLRDAPLEARGERNQSLAVLRQQLLVDARLVVEPLEVAVGHQLAQVAVTRLILGQQHEVVRLVAAAGFLVTALLGHVDLAADDGLEPLLPGDRVELRPPRRGCRGR